MVYLLAGSTLMSCAQEKKKTFSLGIADLYKEVKFRDQQTNYRANIQAGACNFSLLINEVPVVQYFEEANGSFSNTAPINNLILKSGKQTYKLILYPGYKDGKPAKQLSENLIVNISIEGFKYSGSHIDKVGAPVPLLSLSSRDQTFKQAGQDSAVFEGNFDLKVPYVLKGWSDSKDLRKEDPAVLLKEILAAYQEYGDLLKAKDAEGLTRLVYQKEKDYAQALFLDQEGSKKQWNTYRTMLDAKKLEMEPIENYKLKFYGSGRLVTLERKDYPYIGQPALRADVTDAQGEEYLEYYFNYLHKQPGSDKLEWIR